MYTGVSLLDARAHRDLPQSGCLIRDAYRMWIDRGEIVMGVVDASSFRDAGITPAHYLEANLALLEGHERWTGVRPDLDANVIAKSAHVGTGATLRSCAIGEGAALSPHVHLERCVVWPHTRVDASASDMIFTPKARVPIVWVNRARPMP
jgi:NDP-sugar pyrophosphorylase family protein